MLVIGKTSALDLPIKGSVGSFAVAASGAGSSSVRVQYLLTHVGFAVSGESEEKLLQNLKPVREVFRVAELEFDELMQRDIDDGRVSTELIPYLLRDHGKVLVKLFPPIIVVVLPTNEQGRPSAAYPTVKSFDEHDKNHGVEWRVTRSGEVGAEAFEFRQLKQGDEVLEHDYAQLTLNSTKCKLAIVDGQHRAMALLALYRNLKGWPAEARPFQEYYGRWSKSELEAYDLTKIRLPVMLITFPDLDKGPATFPRVTEACRSVFLALNKNAKRVSAARNYLLDDSDVIAHLLRTTLSQIESFGTTASEAIRIWNVELDADGDKRKLTSTTAITGAMHLYGLIEFLMLNKTAPGAKSLGHPRQNLWKQRDLTDCLRRLGARERLGADKAEGTKRNFADDEASRVVADLFAKSYGRSIIMFFDRLAPYRAIADASNALEKKLSADSNGATYHSILFDGQGQGLIFDGYVEKLKSIRDEYAEMQQPVPPQIQASHEEFERRAKELDKLKAEFKTSRNARYLHLSEEKAAPYGEAMADLFGNTFTTEAFQWAVLITFWSAAERVLEDSKLASDTALEWFPHYLDALNSVLDPVSPVARTKLIATFFGEVDSAGGDTRVNKSSRCLKRIVVPGELKPDEWPKFRYMLLEIWGSHGKGDFPDAALERYVEEQRLELRMLALTAFEERELRHEAEKRGVLSSELDHSTMSSVLHECKKSFCEALRKIGVEINMSQLQQLARKPSEAPPAMDPDDDID